MPLPDIYLEGLARDIALKRAAESQAPPSHIVIGAAVDAYTGALRANRALDDGSLAVGPARDYWHNFREFTTLYDETDPAGAFGFLTFDTPFAGWMILTTQYTAVYNDGRCPHLEVHTAPLLTLYSLVYATPIMADAHIDTHVIPLTAPRHTIRVVGPAPDVPGPMTIRYTFLPPGIEPPGPTPRMYQLLHGVVDVATTQLAVFKDPRCRRARFHMHVSAVAAALIHFRVDIYPFVALGSMEPKPIMDVRLPVCPIHTTVEVGAGFYIEAVRGLMGSATTAGVWLETMPGV